MSTALRSLSNHDLLSSTRNVVARERGITIEVLDHLNEVERRKLYLELGHSSMFAYCTEELRYSASAAKRRISTARCIAQFPAALPLLQADEINLSTITQISKIINEQNSRALLERIRNKSQREVEAIVAEYEPLAALPRERARTVVVRVPVGSFAAVKPEETVSHAPVAPATAPLREAPHDAIEQVQDHNGPEPELRAAPVANFERRTVIQFCAREEVMNKLEGVRALASHRLPANAPLEQVIEFLADYFTRREDPKARHERREARAQDAKPTGTPKTSSARAIPLPVRDEVFVRDQGRCCYVGLDGKRCASTHVVQIDHVMPVARGGSASIDNLRLLCAYHNRLEAERVLGRSKLGRQVRNGPELDI